MEERSTQQKVGLQSPGVGECPRIPGIARNHAVTRAAWDSGREVEDQVTSEM